MSIADQVHNKIMSILLYQIAYSFTDGSAPLSPDLEDNYYNAVNVKVSYEDEIQTVLGEDSQMLSWGGVMALAEEITLPDLFGTDDDMYVDQVSAYVAKFPSELKKWHDHLLTLLD